MFNDLKKSAGMILSEIGVKEPNDFTLVIAGTEIPVVSGRVSRSIDTCADGCSAVVALTDTVRGLVRPFGFEEAQVFLGGELVLTGYVYSLEPRISSSEEQLTIGIYSGACDLVDSTWYPPYEFNLVTLQDVADEMIGGLGLTAVFEGDTGSEHFDRVCIDPQQAIFDFFMDLCKQRGVLISSNEKGEVLFRRADVSGSPLETISNVTSLEGSFDARELYAIYRVCMMAPEAQVKTRRLKSGKLRKTDVTVQTKKYAEAYDSLVPASRQTTVAVDNVHIDSLPQAAEWERSRRWARALTISVPRISWRSKNSDTLYRENTIVTLKTEKLWLEDGFDFLIKSVEYQLDSDGAVAMLTLIPPQAYTGDPVPDVFGGSAALSGVLKSLGLSGI